MKFTNRWENVDDGVWETNDNAKYKNGAIIVQVKKDQFVMLTWRLAGDDIASLQTARHLPHTLEQAKALAEEFIERLEKFDA